MIFISKNENGEAKIDKILAMKPGDRMATRRVRPVKEGSIRSVQPGRGKTHVTYIKVVSCVLHEKWFRKHIAHHPMEIQKQRLDDEARLEGFGSWQALLSTIERLGMDINDLYRIEFVKANIP